MEHVQLLLKKQSNQGLSWLILLPKHAKICSKRVNILQMFEAQLKVVKNKIEI